MENKSLIKENIFTNKIKRILFNLLKKLKIKKNDDYDTKKTNKNAEITDVYKNNQIKKNEILDLYKDIKNKKVDPNTVDIIKLRMLVKLANEEVMILKNKYDEEITKIRINEREIEYYTISAVNLENIGFTEEFNAAVEAKTTNQQKAEAEKAQLEIIKVQNEQKINTAEAEAKVRELQSQSVTEQSLEQLRLENQRAMIEKWNGVMPTYMLGENTNALFNLGQ